MCTDWTNGRTHKHLQAWLKPDPNPCRFASHNISSPSAWPWLWPPPHQRTDSHCTDMNTPRGIYKTACTGQSRPGSNVKLEELQLLQTLELPNLSLATGCSLTSYPGHIHTLLYTHHHLKLKKVVSIESLILISRRDFAVFKYSMLYLTTFETYANCKSCFHGYSKRLQFRKYNFAPLLIWFVMSDPTALQIKNVYTFHPPLFSWSMLLVCYGIFIVITGLIRNEVKAVVYDGTKWYPWHRQLSKWPKKSVKSSCLCML